ncbi:MAG: hypothetical protein DRJ68_03105 [Thermoprotei archaeon]|nr:MAG: hypothetical protein DRJ62_03445 [Thermoprotei archaeon]RLF21578.1 MAG: hypothetical protein DRJ68_03105 [Thermoprotei archaeon]
MGVVILVEMEVDLRPPVVEKFGVKISRVMVGTSPFIAAGQFEKSHQYYLEFVARRGAVAEILSWCFKRGLSWVQAIDVDSVAHEVKAAREMSKVDPVLVVSTWDGPREAVERFKPIKPLMVLAHAMITDSASKDEIKSFIEEAEGLGVIPGVVTHSPLKSIRKVKGVEGLRAVMIPMNYAGLYNTNVEETMRELRGMNVVVIAKKVLGAGRLEVSRAISWVMERPDVDSVAIGVASIREAEETFSLACKLAWRRASSQG